MVGITYFLVYNMIKLLIGYLREMPFLRWCLLYRFILDKFIFIEITKKAYFLFYR